MLQIRRIYNNMLPALTGRSKVRVSDRATVLQLTGILQTLTKICYLLQSNLYPADTFWTSASWPSDSWNHFMTSKCILLSIMICNLSICPLNNLKTQFVYAFFFSIVLYSIFKTISSAQWSIKCNKDKYFPLLVENLL